MNKKGISTQQYIWTFYIIICIVIFVLLVNYIRAEITGESSKQIILAKNLGLTLDSVYASNGDLNLNYYFNNTFVIESKESLLTVQKTRVSSYGFYIIAQDEDNLNLNFETDSVIIKSEKGDISVHG